MHLADIFLNGGAAFDPLFDRYGDVLWLTVPKFIEILCLASPRLPWCAIRQ